MDGAVLEIDGGHFIHLDVDVVIVAKHVAQGEGGVAG